MSDYYAVVYSDSLSHHGIKGQKWGQRRFQNSDGSLTDAGRKRYGFGMAVKGGPVKENARQSSGQHQLKLGNRTIDTSLNPKKAKRMAPNEKLSNAFNKRVAKEKAREAKKAETRNKVREYKKQFDKASEMSDAADEKWREARSQYDSLAKTRVGRIREVIKAQKGNGSAAAKEYLKNADIASEMQDKADAAWRETHKKRMATGKTAVSRFVNAVRYN